MSYLVSRYLPSISLNGMLLIRTLGTLFNASKSGSNVPPLSAFVTVTNPVGSGVVVFMRVGCVSDDVLGLLAGGALDVEGAVRSLMDRKLRGSLTAAAIASVRVVAAVGRNDEM